MRILILNNQWQKKSLDLAEKYCFTPINEPVRDYYLVIESGVLKVRHQGLGRRFSIDLDFEKEIRRIQEQKRNFKTDILCRSLGYRGQKFFKVIDGTLGIGHDALCLVSFGIHVLGFESNPTIFCLLNSALERASHLKGSFEIRQMDCCEWVSQFFDGSDKSDNKRDCLYLDPFFEGIEKKSKPRKSMAFLRSFRGGGCHIQKVIPLALGKGIKRVVVKRPIKGDYLYGKPNFLYKGKLIRYDVYIH